MLGGNPQQIDTKSSARASHSQVWILNTFSQCIRHILSRQVVGEGEGCASVQWSYLFQYWFIHLCKNLLSTQEGHEQIHFRNSRRIITPKAGFTACDVSSLEQTHLVWWPIVPLHPGYVAALEVVKITVNLEQRDGMILTSTWPSNLATPILHSEQNYNSLHLEKLITISLELIDGIMFSLKCKILNPLLHRQTYYALGMT